jgi:predicted enzyme related to lactoylglutathione lyase
VKRSAGSLPAGFMADKRQRADEPSALLIYFAVTTT